jgi:hypothetical protein
VSAVRDAGIGDRTFVSSFLPEVVGRLRRLDPRLGRFFLTKRWTAAEERDARLVQPHGICLERGCAVPGVVQRIHELGMGVVAWTVNDPREAPGDVRDGGGLHHNQRSSGAGPPRSRRGAGRAGVTRTVLACTAFTRIPRRAGDATLAPRNRRGARPALARGSWLVAHDLSHDHRIRTRGLPGALAPPCGGRHGGPLRFAGHPGAGGVHHSPERPAPADLWDYRARVRSLVQLSLGGDEEEGRELPITADEFLSDVRWHATGRLEQRVVQHRMRVSVPTPYTIGSLLDDPWVIPHLYGSIGGIVTLAATPAGATRTEGRVVHPFSQLGPELYRYTAGDTVRIRIQNELVTVVPVSVRPRTGVAGDAQLLVGTFLVDVDRGAVARARFGVVERRRGVRVSDLGSFLELENMLWEGRFWLPFRQRQEIQLGSRLFGGTVGVRIVNDFTDLRINDGWQPETDGWILVRDAVTEELEPLPRTAVGDDAGEYDITDFADLRRAATAAERGDLTGVRVGFHARRAGHIFRHNRVEGLFLGAGAILEPADPLDNRWDVYATGGYAIGENALRGEVTGRYRLTGTVPAARARAHRPHRGRLSPSPGHARLPPGAGVGLGLLPGLRLRRGGHPRLLRCDRRRGRRVRPGIPLAGPPRGAQRDARFRRHLGRADPVRRRGEGLPAGRPGRCRAPHRPGGRPRLPGRRRRLRDRLRRDRATSRRVGGGRLRLRPPAGDGLRPLALGAVRARHPAGRGAHLRRTPAAAVGALRRHGGPSRLRGQRLWRHHRRARPRPLLVGLPPRSASPIRVGGGFALPRSVRPPSYSPRGGGPRCARGGCSTWPASVHAPPTGGGGRSAPASASSTTC